MRKPLLFLFGLVAILAGGAALIRWYLHDKNVALLQSAGTIADRQQSLLIWITILSLVIVLPVFALTFYVVVRYREGNTKAKYTPEFDHQPVLETIWWAIPSVIILILAVVTWQTSHELDPYKPLASNKKPITVQVVALPWRWLFIYPDQNVATINYLNIPAGRPVNFEITADAPMNSFWIPQLGGQVYAMAGMETKLHLMADKTGTYRGSSANLSGEGFSKMNFPVNAMPDEQFNAWANGLASSDRQLYTNSYENLAQPSDSTDKQSFKLADAELFEHVIGKYMSHSASNQTEHKHED